MKSEAKKKLSLKKETLRELTPERLKEVAGGTIICGGGDGTGTCCTGACCTHSCIA